MRDTSSAGSPKRKVKLESQEAQTETQTYQTEGQTQGSPENPSKTYPTLKTYQNAQLKMGSLQRHPS
jgi:hypothetical protein